VARTLPRSALAITVDSSQSGPNRALPSAATPALGGGGSTEGQGLVPAPPDAQLTPRSEGDPALLDVEEGSDDELTDYNRYLALLAVRGNAKTWRNPHGL
jgi:hypothetical protein